MKKRFLVFSCCLLFACSPTVPEEKTFLLIWGGERAHGNGEFNRPRGSIYDKANNLIYIVDWDGRIQKFAIEGYKHPITGNAINEGQFLGSWIMPKVKNGKPEDLCLDKDGNLLVTDTHYSRIVRFSPKGKVLDTFGKYGGGEGEFIYPVGICIDKLGNIYVSEYGDNNRIQKFTHEGKFLISFGGFGNAVGKFQRPSGIAIGPDERLYVSDAVNHRIQVFTLDGEFVKSIGQQGRKLGDMTYPYDVCFKGGYMYVLEYGGPRVQKMTLDGVGIEFIGSAGTGDGQFASPWRFSKVNEYLFISDTDNSRVVKILF
ncbi:MAG: hypothetical protein HRT89_24045 [Lentisphaeria bacterium]|nr:hypothetical protein [Lentisphaeria bacterium]NQZ71130.1 hypothetical protein [Lentisphaeria bacterium]